MALEASKQKNERQRNEDPEKLRRQEESMRVLDEANKLFEESGPVNNVFASVEEGKVSPDEAKRVAYEWMDRYDKFCKERPSSSPDYYAPYLPWGAADAEKIFSPEVIYRNTLIQFFRMQKSLDRKVVK